MRLTPIARLTATACLALCAAAPAASAAQRYAAATSTTTTGSCSASSPCTLTWAIMGAAANDSVTVRPGDYTISSQIKPTVPVHISGDPSLPMPSVVAVAPMLKDGLDLGAGSSIRHMRIESTVPDRDAIDLHGAVGEDLILVISSDASGSGKHPPAAAHLVGATPTTILRNSVAYATGEGSAAVVVTSSKSPGPSDTAGVFNVTAISVGSDAAAIESTQTSGTTEIRNIVARGYGPGVAAGDVIAGIAGLISIGSSNFRPSSGPALTDLGGNQSADPTFVNSAAGDFHVRSGSPLIDAGSSAALSANPGEVDPDGRPRRIGSAPDIGAFEFDAGLSAGTTLAAGGTAGTATESASGPRTAPLAAPLATALASGLTPRLGKSVIVRALKGVVTVKSGASAKRSVPSSGVEIPVGSIVDTTRGTVELTSVRDGAGKLQAAQFWGGRFTVMQKGAGDTTTALKLVGGSRRACRAKSSSARRSIATTARRPKPIRRLWARDDHGRFRTHGHDSVATVRGTHWLTEDRCSGTLTRVMSGSVLVRNLHTKRSKLVRAGKSYLARRAG